MGARSERHPPPCCLKRPGAAGTREGLVAAGQATPRIGTTYHNTSKFMGRETELTYEVVEHRPDAKFALRGENSSVVAHDTMDIAPLGEGSHGDLHRRTSSSRASAS